ncbi:MAG: CHAT domain-containing protein [Bacteroidales bacterium]|nr:CHAT domain-containing protein [Bacteroidales bacterium]
MNFQLGWNHSFLLNPKISIDIGSNISCLYIDMKLFNETRTITTYLLSEKYSSLTKDQNLILQNNHAVALGNVNFAPEANKIYDKLFDIIEDDFPSGSFEPYLSYLNAGKLQQSLGNYALGVKYLQEATEWAIKKYGTDHLHTANSFFRLAQGYEKAGFRDSCYQLLNKSIDIMLATQHEPILPLNSYETVLIEMLIERGRFMLEQNNHMRAYSDFRLVINRIERLSQINTSESTRFIIAKKGQEAFRMGILCALNLYKESGIPSYLNQAFEWSIQAKSLSLYWLSLRDYVYPIAGIPLDSLSKLQLMREKILNWQDKVDILNMKAPDTSDLKRISKTALQYELLEQQILKNYELIRKASDENAITGLLIPENFRHESYLGYQDIDSLLIVFGVNKNERFFQVLQLDSALKTDIENYKKLLTATRSGVYNQSEVIDFQRLSNRVYKGILEPVESVIKSKNLALHLDGCLLGLPFESLVHSTPESVTYPRFKDLNYLLHHYHFRYVASPFLLKKDFKHVSRQKSLLLTCPDQLNHLSIGSEAYRLQKIIHQLEIQRLDRIGPEFKEEMHEYKNIHISSHLLSQSNDFMESGLVCGSENPSTILPFKDILYSELNHAHIYLNGCESGTGPINHGEGLMSLSLAYTMAGAASVVQHLWKAPDEAATEIAVQYYRNNRKRKSEWALQMAKMTYLKNTKSGHDHPFYWAGIVYFGYRSKTNNKPYVYGGSILALGLAFFYFRKRIFR